MTADSQRDVGTLYIVSTPIGNLKDISFRAVEVLSHVDIIAAEDTRRSAILLNHYNISTKTTSYFDFNKEKKTPILLAMLKRGESVAVISDAGTPGISDPAFNLVRAAIKEDIPIIAIPGATAFVPALIVSGLPCDRFVFEGFLPAKKGRKKRIQQLVGEERTIILYESPNKIERTNNDLHDALGNRRVCVVRELTKKFEQIYRGTLEELCTSHSIKQKGEFVIVIEGNKNKVHKENEN